MAVNKLLADVLAERLAQMRQEYQARLPAALTSLVSLADGLNGSENDPVILEDLQHQLHKLAGSGGTFGFDNLSVRARALEVKIKQWLVEGHALDAHASVRKTLNHDLMVLGEVLLMQPLDINRMTVQSAEPDDIYSKSLLIWLVEDDLNLAGQLRRQLESFGYIVCHFSSISEAEAAAQMERPDMLIMDVMFPLQEENATEVLSMRPTLRGLGCPLLFISANDDFASRARAARLGAEGYFLKPLDVPRLVNRMAQIFDQKRAPPQRVLIVDDDVELAAHYQLVLLAAGMSAVVLDDPQDIIETVATVRPELVLMDLHMPNFTGPELAGVIRQHEHWVGMPIVYLSAETDVNLQNDAMSRGADDFLTKPISDAQLVAAVRVRVDRARQLDAQISKDSLTGLLKHASIKESLELEVQRARRVKKTVSVAMLDIDHFKSVNDTYGHAVGDVVISAIAMLLRQRLRQSDIVGRYGGEEFVAVLPECDVADARTLLDDIRERFAAVEFSHNGQTFTCTLSAGLATSMQHPQANGTELLVNADEALYAAKHGGRNQVRASEDI